MAIAQLKNVFMNIHRGRWDRGGIGASDEGGGGVEAK